MSNEVLVYLIAAWIIGSLWWNWVTYDVTMKLGSVILGLMLLTVYFYGQYVHEHQARIKLCQNLQKNVQPYYLEVYGTDGSSIKSPEKCSFSSIDNIEQVKQSMTDKECKVLRAIEDSMEVCNAS